MRAMLPFNVSFLRVCMLEPSFVHGNKLGADDYASAPGLSANLAFEGAEFEGDVKRAKGDDGGQQEHSAESDQQDACCAGNDPAKIQVGEHGSEKHADDTVKVGQVAFHVKISFGGLGL